MSQDPFDDSPFSEAEPAPFEDKAAPPAASSEVSGRGAPVAVGGKRINLAEHPQQDMPQFPAWVAAEHYKVDDVDFVDLSALNRQINTARVALFKANKFLTEAQRSEASAKYEYKRAHNRAMVTLSGGSEKQRLATADVMTEELYGNWLVKERVVEEMVNHVRAIRTELDSLTILSHNMRAQMNMQ